MPYEEEDAYLVLPMMGRQKEGGATKVIRRITLHLPYEEEDTCSEVRVT